MSHDFEPETTSAARFSRRIPYTNKKTFAEGLAKLAERGWLESVGDGEYRITAAGHAIVDAIEEVLATNLAQSETLPAADLQRIITLLGRLVEAALAAPEPPDKTTLIYNRHSDPGPEGPALLQILQYLADLNAFRDDAHLGAWRPTAVSGPAWEAFTFVWRDDAHTAAELAEKLPARRFTEADYAAALNELVAKGWVEERAGRFEMTAAGRSLREAVEAETDRTYYAAWSCLSDAEVAELGDHLVALRDALQAFHPSPEGT